MDDLSVTLRLLSEDEIRRIAVVSITNAGTTDHGTPKQAGLMDARMGSTDRSILCQTCHVPHCAGHMGMIEFPMRVLLVGHIKYVLALLRCVCYACAKPVFDSATIPLDKALGGFDKIKAVAEFCRNRIEDCPHCGSPTFLYAESNKIFISKTVSAKASAKMVPDEVAFHSQRFTPDDIYSILDKIPHETLLFLGLDPLTSHPRNAVTNSLLVLPPTQRPTLRIADGGKGRGEDDMTALYQDVVRANTDLQSKLKPGCSANDPPIWTAFMKLQLMVACLINNGLRRSVDIPGVSAALIAGNQRGAVRTMRDLERRLKGKQGRLRGTLGAKRVDMSARTVIGIDMCEDIWRLGMPETRMKTLTVPVKVTDLNLEDLQKRVIRGAHEKNGAVNILQPIDGQEPRIIFLGLMTHDMRMTLAASLRVGWTVERHMIDGDWVLFNRQPTLHKMSIQAFQVRTFY